MNELRPKSLLCVVAHPDDIEVMIGGAVAKWIAQGTEVHYLICTDGQKGTNKSSDDTIVRMRAFEQHEAAQALGVHCSHQLDYVDGEVELSKELVKDIVKCIRAHSPEVVFTIDPSFLYSTEFNYPNHRDHRIIGQAVFDAVYPCSRDASAFPELVAEGYEPHCVETLLMGNYDKQNYYEDITDVFEDKMTALKKHQSQFPDGEFITKIMQNISQSFGERSGFELAEGFIKLDIFSPPKG